MDDNSPEGDRSEAEQRELELLSALLAGAAAPYEREALEARLREDSTLERRIAEARLIWERAGHVLDVEVTDIEHARAKRRLLDAISSDATHAGEPIARTNVRRSHAQGGDGRLPWGRGILAASVLLLLAAGVWSVREQRPRQEPVVRSVQREVRVSTAAGERRSVTLSDGTRVTLAPASSLVTPADFGTQQRSTRLEGQAYFEVATDSARPFLVHTVGAVTRVLGTEFDVQAYRGSDETSVTVRSGRVSLESTAELLGDAVILTAYERGTVSVDGETRVETGIDAERLLAWTQGTLSFRARPFRDVAPELERWFNVRIQMSDSILADRRITATFTGEPADTVLQTIADIIHARWQRAGGAVVFSPR